MTTSVLDAAQPATSPDDLTASLHWRYATKQFDPSRRIDDGTWQALEGSLVLSPSSYGLQPWRFVVVDDPDLRTQLRGASYDQPQIADAAKLVVFAARKDFGPSDIERHVARVAEVRRVPLSSLVPFRHMMEGLLTRPAATVESWVARQVYIALGTFLTSAAVLGVDACPMEGIDPAEYDRILGLLGQGYTALCVAAAGYRAQSDDYAKVAKVRFDLPEVVQHF